MPDRIEAALLLRRFGVEPYALPRLLFARVGAQEVRPAHGRGRQRTPLCSSEKWFPSGLEKRPPHEPPSCSHISPSGSYSGVRIR